MATTRVKSIGARSAGASEGQRMQACDSIVPEAGEDFVLTPAVAQIVHRALVYLRSGYPVHLAGPAGTGKTTLAFHIAAELRRPVSLIHGNDEFGSSDLIGKDAGYKKSLVVDNFIHSVLKTEEQFNVHWSNNRLTTACEEGHTLIYDEFNRTKPEANNILLSIFEERILDLPKTGGRKGFLSVHPDFRAVLTSNPDEYAGVHRAQDALLDRLITIHVGHYDEETERRIAVSKSGITEADAAFVVSLIRAIREVGGNPYRPTIRGAIALCRVLAHEQRRAAPDDELFMEVARDVLLDDFTDGGELKGEQFGEFITELWSLQTEQDNAQRARPRRAA